MKPYPILLIHGIDDTSARMRKMRTALIAQGFNPVHAMDIIPSNGSISLKAMGVQVLNAVQSLLINHNASKLDIVAYSMGAIAARYFLQRLGGKTIVRRYISLAGPHHGSYLAYLRYNLGGRQLRPGSALLSEMNTEKDPWGDVQVFSFRTWMDLSVIPSKSSILPEVTNQTFTVWLHPCMVSDKRVIEAVVQTLAVPDN